VENSKVKNQPQNIVKSVWDFETNKKKEKIYNIIFKEMEFNRNFKRFNKLKMRCTICDKTVKYANTATRTRRMCGNCYRSVKQLLNTAKIKI